MWRSTSGMSIPAMTMREQSGNSMKIIHIVRHYGPVGGMERYVWETTRELARLGHQVQVLCEQSMTENPPNIAVHELGRMAPRPRWLGYWRFSRRVQTWLNAHAQPGWLVHSHERTGVDRKSVV